MSAIRVLMATARKDFRTAVSYRMSFIGAIVASVWALISFRFISKLVDTGQFSGNSVSYFRYIVVGLVFVSILEPTAVGTSNSARSDQVQGTLEYMASQPVRRLYLGLSWTMYSILESSVIAVGVLLLTIPLGFRISHINVPVVVAVIVLSILIFAAVGSIGAGIVIVYQQGGGIIAAGFAVVAAISGTLFPISEFPGWLQVIAHLSPLTYGLEALRSALLSKQPSTSYAQDLLILVGFAIVLIPIASVSLERAFRVAQKRGSLSTF